MNYEFSFGLGSISLMGLDKDRETVKLIARPCEHRRMP